MLLLLLLLVLFSIGVGRVGRDRGLGSLLLDGIPGAHQSLEGANVCERSVLDVGRFGLDRIVA